MFQGSITALITPFLFRKADALYERMGPVLGRLGFHSPERVEEEGQKQYCVALLGFHRIAPGRRVPSMMAPTVVLRDGEIELALGSAGSNRIRSAILQTVVRAVEQRLPPAAAIEAARLHFEQGVVQAEPGIDEEALGRIEARGVPVLRRPRINLFFGGVQAVARDQSSGAYSGGGDPRRGGAVAYA